MTEIRTNEEGTPPPPPPISSRMTGAAGGSSPRGDVAGERWRVVLLAAGVVALGVLAGRGWLLIIGALFVMVFLHELGHFITAKWTGMKVTEFFIGVGPKVWSFRRGETEYGIKVIPLVAYVRIIGMNNLDEVPPADEPRTYRQQSYPRRLLVVSAGSIMHLLQAFVLFIIVFSVLGAPAGTRLADDLGGTPDESAWELVVVSEGSAAEKAGIRPGDDIVAIDGEQVVGFSDVGELIEGRAGDDVTISIVRDGRPLDLEATLGHRDGDPDAAFLGVGADYPSVTAGPVRAVTEAGTTTVSFLGQTATNLTSFFTGGLGDFASDVIGGANTSSGGPAVGDGGSTSGGGGGAASDDESRLVSIYGVARIGASMGDDDLAGFLILLAVVNISIGVLNMIPLLPLDGGHAAIATYERIRSTRGRRHMVDVSRLLPLTYAVFLFLIMLGASSMYLDIVDPIGVG